jgi:phospholipid/cholesterol/gamma-HCH transport system substrate-binding protein
VRRRSRVTNFAAGTIGILILVVICYLVFGGGLPFASSPYVLKAVFTTNTQLHIPSEVRTAGVKVGEVVSVTRIKGESPTSQAAIVTMDIQNNGLPIHGDATVNVRPRIFLEGNFYVNLMPGTPSAPVLASGSTLSAPQASGPVQLDRVLADLTSDPRANLQTLLQGLGGALNAPAIPSIDAQQDPIVRGLTGGQALNLSLKYSVDAFRSTAMVNQALLGIQPNDLAGVVKGNEQVFSALSASGQSLPQFVDSFNTTLGALAARQQELSQTIALLPPWLEATDRLLGPLNASFAPTKEFAAALIPGIEQLDPTIGTALPWLQQSIDLVSNKYLGGLLTDLTPAVQNTSAALTATKQLLEQSDLFAQCFTHNILPAGNQRLQDPPGGTTGRQVYQEFFQSAVGLAGSAQNFDGNGRYMRASAGGGSIRFQTSSIRGAGPLFGNAVVPPLGTRPAYPGHAPPVVENVACFKNPAPDLNNVSTGQAP